VGQEGGQGILTRDFVAGGFTWTGWDYKGEPQVRDGGYMMLCSFSTTSLGCRFLGQGVHVHSFTLHSIPPNTSTFLFNQ
jgi:hypothetical protein